MSRRTWFANVFGGRYAAPLSPTGAALGSLGLRTGPCRSPTSRAPAPNPHSAQHRLCKISRDFAPWRFSDAGHRPPHPPHAGVRETCTSTDNVAKGCMRVCHLQHQHLSFFFAAPAARSKRDALSIELRNRPYGHPSRLNKYINLLTRVRELHHLRQGIHDTQNSRINTFGGCARECLFWHHDWIDPNKR